MPLISDIDEATAILEAYQETRRTDPGREPGAADRARLAAAQHAFDAYAAINRPNAVNYVDDAGAVIWHRAEPRPAAGAVATVLACWISWLCVGVLYLHLQERLPAWLLLAVTVLGVTYLSVCTTRHVRAWRRYLRARAYRVG